MLSAIPFDLITGIFSFLFTLLILSYLVGDNPAFRLAVHAFVGVSAGYIALIIFQQVIVNKLFLPLASGTLTERILLSFPLVLSLMLLGKTSARLEWMGRPVMAFLVGVGTASAVAGAITGTLFPQILAVLNLFDLRRNLPNTGAMDSLLTAFFVLIGTVVTLAYFQFTLIARGSSADQRGAFLKFISMLGQVFIAITLGAIFAGVLAAALTAMVDRAQSMVLFFNMLFTKFIF